MLKENINYSKTLEIIEEKISQGLPRTNIINLLEIPQKSAQKSAIFKDICISGWGNRDFEIYTNADPGVENTLTYYQKQQISHELGKKAFDYYIHVTNPENNFSYKRHDTIEYLKKTIINQEIPSKIKLVKKFNKYSMGQKTYNKLLNIANDELQKDGENPVTDKETLKTKAFHNKYKEYYKIINNVLTQGGNVFTLSKLLPISYHTIEKIIDTEEFKKYNQNNL
jgi:hypothetical protein